MEQPLLTIGAFARAVGLAPSALRYYDECGLLRPAEVDEATGYRYYTPDLAQRARVVVQLRDAGLPIEAMHAVLDGAPEDRQRVLAAVRAEQEAIAARRTAALEDLLAEPSEPRERATLAVAGPDLSAAIRQVRAAADTEPTSPLAGVLIDVAAGTVDVVATNRFWMAVRTLPGTATGDARAALSLPEAARVCEALDRLDEAELEFDETGITVGDQKSKLLDVAYPAHRMVLAGLPPATTRVVVSRQGMIEAIEAIGHAEFDLVVDADVVHVGDHQLEAVCEAPPTTLRLGSALVRRALACALGEHVVLRISSETRPVQVTTPAQPGFLALIMPIARTTA